ncbi:MAG: 3-deoxy-manno-octulosonate cytidylyltransferase [Gammaproteobacteria bacterium]|nr:3-deoxy-manno-octulosonate cytidylyltransferase [Gammaproteobacteria bacterium]PCH62231.1 MAG: 3-deoxy-manno-octulosonate cytidylyltransferase [Gammaproteobacteria bacterium]
MFNIIIPARYASQRLPGKPLRDIAGKPMIQHVYERACQSGAKEVVIATDDQRVADAATHFGAIACMTSDQHRSGTDRIAEVIQLRGYGDDEIIVNMQGDEPTMPTQLLSLAAEHCANSGADIVTAAEWISDSADVFNPNVVKVVVDDKGYALYFSRAPIPWDRSRFSDSDQSTDTAVHSYRRHIGLYAYRAGFVKQYVTWPAGKLEKLELLEQLRALEQGKKILVFDTPCDPGFGVDTEEDLAKVIALLSR